MSRHATDRQVGGTYYADMKIQFIDFIHANAIPFIEASVIKYVCRHRKKGGRGDILKAIHYLEMLLEKEYPKD